MDLHVKFDGKEIIVTWPGTDFMLRVPQTHQPALLILTRSWANPTVTLSETVFDSRSASADEVKRLLVTAGNPSPRKKPDAQEMELLTNFSCYSCNQLWRRQCEAF